MDDSQQRQRANVVVGLARERGLRTREEPQRLLKPSQGMQRITERIGAQIGIAIHVESHLLQAARIDESAEGSTAR